jgi:hypothetical protein
MGPDYEPIRRLNRSEQTVARRAEREQKKAEWLIEAIAGASAVDGAVLMTSGLQVIGFGCKLPGARGRKIPVIQRDEKGSFKEFDLAARGTRHTAAARFAYDQRGGISFIASADGPAGCFVWNEQQGAVIYWPIYVDPGAQ